MADERIRTTVILPAYRAALTLPRVLDALCEQLRPEREVVLVQSGVGEASARSRIDDCTASEHWPWLRLVQVNERLSPAAARNRGAEHARGELLVFLDADAVPGETWLDELERGLNRDVDAVAGSILNGTPLSATGSAEYLLECSETFPRRPRPIRHAPGANLLVRREHFASVSGFREDLRAGEDTVLTFGLAKRQRLAFARDASVRHLNRTRLMPFLANQRLQGAGFVAVGRVVPYPNRWVCRGPAIVLAGPLRLLALARCIVWNPSEAGTAVRALPQLLLGTAAWTLGAFQERTRVTGRA